MVIFIYWHLDEFAKKISLVNILNLVIFIFLDLNKIGFKLLSLTISSILALIIIETDLLYNQLIFNIKVKNMAILPKF